MSDKAIDARSRLHKAFIAVGPELSGILYHVCCLAGGLEHAERMLTLPTRSGKAVLALALTSLARHYGLIGSDTARRSECWALPDFRPKVPPSTVAQQSVNLDYL